MSGNGGLAACRRPSPLPHRDHEPTINWKASEIGEVGPERPIDPKNVVQETAAASSHTVVLRKVSGDMVSPLRMRSWRITRKTAI